jgi:hypothetical protein
MVQGDTAIGIRYTRKEVVCYASAPSDFDRQLSKGKIEQAMQTINAAMNHADEATKRFALRFMTRHSTGLDQELIEKQNTEPLERAYRKINAAKERLERPLERTSAQRSRICGVLDRPTKPSAHLGRRV